MTVTPTGHLPPDTSATSTTGSVPLAGTSAMKVPQIGSPVSQLNEATTPGRTSQVCIFVSCN